MDIIRYISIIIEQVRCVTRIRYCGHGHIGYVDAIDEGDAHMEYLSAPERLLSRNWHVHWNYLTEKEPWVMEDFDEPA
jgi:hypothetical protein